MLSVHPLLLAYGDSKLQIIAKGTAQPRCPHDRPRLPEHEPLVTLQTAKSGAPQPPTQRAASPVQGVCMRAGTPLPLLSFIFFPFGQVITVPLYQVVSPFVDLPRRVLTDAICCALVALAR